jgi:pyruvate dehydrogenase E1 component alpha subunit/2-oxoisovalerate dehydrogenase E1 component
MDVVSVKEAAQSAADAVRAGYPRFLLCQTYRFRPHSMFDPELYRTKDEVDMWKKRCPIATFIERLRGADRITQADVDKIEVDVKAEVSRAIAFAEAGQWEPVDDLLRDVTGSGGRA